MAKDQPPLSNVPAKAHFGIGRVDVCLSQALLEGSWADADRELSIVIDEFESGNHGTKDLAAEAHAERAVVRLPAASDPDPPAAYAEAEAEYRAAIDLRPIPIARPSSMTASAGCWSGWTGQPMPSLPTTRRSRWHPTRRLGLSIATTAHGSGRVPARRSSRHQRPSGEDNDDDA